MFSWDRGIKDFPLQAIELKLKEGGDARSLAGLDGLFAHGDESVLAAVHLLTHAPTVHEPGTFHYSGQLADFDFAGIAFSGLDFLGGAPVYPAYAGGINEILAQGSAGMHSV